jgi:HAD superfamily hydrolase (TIGR01509 family)
VREIRLVIFDCDGVLVDSEPVSSAVLAEALSTVGLPMSAEEAQARYRGRVLAEIGADAERRVGGPLPEGFWERYEASRDRTFDRSLEPIEGAAEAVRAVASAGIGVCVASQGKRAKTELTLGLTGLRELFAEDAVFSADEVPRGKPFPDLFLHAAARMRTAPALCAVVEDTLIGIRAAVAAGMRAVGLAADADVGAMRKLGAVTISRLSELPAAIHISA